MLKIIYLFLLIIAPASFAGSTDYFFQDSEGDHFLISFESEGRIYLDHQLIRPHQLQIPVSLQSFSSKSELNSYINRKFPQRKSAVSVQKNKNYVSTEVSQVVWEVTQEWTIDWENKYSHWVTENFDANFFVKYNIETDCADVAFALRWIFARIHGLPAANTLAGSLVIFSQDSFRKEWLSLKRDPIWYKDEVFLAALKYILRGAFTGTLLIDGYPIEISRETFLVGTIHLQGGHTMVISEIDYESVGDAPIKKLSSTMPPMVRVLMDEMMIDAEATAETSGGFIRLRWPKKINGKWELVEKENMPFFSREQYTEEFLGDHGHFTLAVIDRLGIDFIPKRIVDRSLEGIQESLKQRSNIVNLGYEFCSQNNCSEGTQAYEDHSTPSRDKRLLGLFEGLFSTAEALSVLDSSLLDYLETELNKRFFTVEDKLFPLKTWHTIFLNFYFSYHPEDTIPERWGLDADSIQRVISKRFTRYQTQREIKLRESLVCTSGNDCSRGSQKWRDLNTFELDRKIKREVYSSYLSLCEKKECNEINDKIQEVIKRIPFFVSEPNYPLGMRRGESVQDYHVLPKGSTHIQLTKNYFLIDNFLWKLNSSFEIVLSDLKSVLYHQSLNSLIYLEGNSLHLLNLMTLEKTSISVNPKLIQLSWVGKEYFSLNSCTNDAAEIGGCDFQIWKIEDNQIQLKKKYQSPFPQSYSNAILSSDVSSIVLGHILKGDRNVFLLLDWGLGEIQEYEFDSPVSLFGQIDGNHILRMNNNQNVLFKNGQVKCTIPLSSDISNFISSEKVLSVWGGQGSEFYSLNSECSVSLIKYFVNGGWAFEAEGNVYLSGFSNNERFHYREHYLRKIPLTPDSFVLASESKEILIANLDRENDFRIKNIFSFELESLRSLPIDPRFISLNCRFSHYCLSRDSNLSVFSDNEFGESYILGTTKNGVMWSDQIRLLDLFQSETVVIGLAASSFSRQSSVMSGSLLEVNGRKIYLPE
jgi:hypothetical protein